MIISRPLKQGDIITIKLTSGEELIASLIEDTDKYVKVSKPRVVVAADNGIGIAPYLFTVEPDNDVKLTKASIVVIELTEKNYASQYTKSTTNLII